MREFLFGGKRVDNGKWVYGNLIQNYDKCYITYKCYINDKYGLFVKYFEVDENTIKQCTGLCNKNYVGIFEGDYIKAKNNDCPYLCKFEDCAFKLVDKNGNVISMKQEELNRLGCEIAGNIYDNEEKCEL